MYTWTINRRLNLVKMNYHFIFLQSQSDIWDGSFKMLSVLHSFFPLLPSFFHIWYRYFPLGDLAAINFSIASSRVSRIQTNDRNSSTRHPTCRSKKIIKCPIGPSIIWFPSWLRGCVAERAVFYPSMMFPCISLYVDRWGIKIWLLTIADHPRELLVAGTD